jgi:hypothetical protein
VIVEPEAHRLHRAGKIGGPVQLDDDIAHPPRSRGFVNNTHRRRRASMVLGGRARKTFLNSARLSGDKKETCGNRWLSRLGQDAVDDGSLRPLTLMLAILAVLRPDDQCQNRAIKMMIGIGTPNSHSRIARPISSSIVAAQARIGAVNISCASCVLRAPPRGTDETSKRFACIPTYGVAAKC